MPTAYIKKLHEQGKGSIADLEHKWDTAKAQAKKEGRADDFAYTTGILNRMVGATHASAVQINAAARLQASKGEEEVTITLTCRGEAKKKLSDLLAGVSYMCAIGCSRQIGSLEDHVDDMAFRPVHFDGDGSDQFWDIKINGKPVKVKD